MDAYSLWSFFTDPILRAPTIGCMLMCLGASLVGVIVFLKKQSLIGEVLSHTSYPGFILAAIAASFFTAPVLEESMFSLFLLFGAFLTSIAGIGLIHWMEKKFHVPTDAALCFVLSTFFGVGLLMASRLQFSATSIYKKALGYLYGQAATMTDTHITIYGFLACFIVFLILFLYKEIQVITFDSAYAQSLGVNVFWMNLLIFSLVTLAVIIGIRSVGVVLMSAMLIAPAVAARQFTNRLSIIFFLAGLFGLISGFLGVYFSVMLPMYFDAYFGINRLILPTGPLIVLSASSICVASLLFAPKKGLFIRLMRSIVFRHTCIEENILKAMWRIDPKKNFSLNELATYQICSKKYLSFILWRLSHKGWIEKTGQHLYQLTTDGEAKAANIVRLHRLWEVYLVDYLGMGAERVHKSAEEMEHILTPELESELIILLKDPKEDPHLQPIPPKKDF